jgi:flagellar hook assembly protein FlgD
VEIRVYDLAGRLVKTLASDTQSAGVHTVSWNGRDSSGARVASGMYLAKLDAAGVVDTRRLVLVR